MAGTVTHPISITRFAGHVRICREGVVVAQSDHALSLREADYPPVLYIPRADADMRHFAPNPRRTHCPYKGEASYFDLPGADAAVWSYEQPKEDVAGIAGHLAFYPDRVTIETG